MLPLEIFDFATKPCIFTKNITYSSFVARYETAVFSKTVFICKRNSLLESLTLSADHAVSLII